MMGYYLGVSYNTPRMMHGAQGGFFSGIGHFLSGAVSHIAPILSALPGAAGRIGSAIVQHPITTAAAGAATGAAVAGAVGHYGGAATSAAPGGLAVHGHLHLGGKRKAAGAMPGMHRRHRRMNPCNVRALRRAIRRAHGFERIAKKVLRFTSPHHKAKPHGFKRPRKRASV
jgi:hypothetical protein